MRPGGRLPVLVALALALVAGPVETGAQIVEDGSSGDGGFRFPISVRADMSSVRHGRDFGTPYPDGSAMGLEAAFGFTHWLQVGVGFTRGTFECVAPTCMPGTSTDADARYGFVRVRAPLHPRARPWLAVGIRSTSYEQTGVDTYDRKIDFLVNARDASPQVEVGADLFVLGWLGVSPSLRYHAFEGRINSYVVEPFESTEVGASIVELKVALVIDPSSR